MSEKNKREAVKKKVRYGAVWAGVAIGVGATFAVSTVVDLVEKGLKKRSEIKEKIEEIKERK